MRRAGLVAPASIDRAHQVDMSDFEQALTESRASVTPEMERDYEQIAARLKQDAAAIQPIGFAFSRPGGVIGTVENSPCPGHGRARGMGPALFRPLGRRRDLATEPGRSIAAVRGWAIPLRSHCGVRRMERLLHTQRVCLFADYG